MDKVDLIIGIVVGIVGAIISLLTFVNKEKRSIERETKEDTEALSKAVSELQYVSRGVDDIKYDIKNLSNSLQSTNERVVKLEMGLEMTNKRIDDLGGK